MDTSNTTMADLASLTPENYRRELTVSARRAGKSEAIARARRAYRGRQVLAPRTRKKTRPHSRLKAARHPWADRLVAARTGGFVVDQTHPGTDKVLGSCYTCGHRFGFVIGDEVGRAAFETEVKRHERSPFDGLRDCERGVAL